GSPSFDDRSVLRPPSQRNRPRGVPTSSAVGESPMAVTVRLSVNERTREAVKLGGFGAGACGGGGAGLGQPLPATRSASAARRPSDMSIRRHLHGAVGAVSRSRAARGG